MILWLKSASARNRGLMPGRMSSLSYSRKFLIQRRIALASLFAECFKLSPAFAEVAVDKLPICHVVSESSKDLLKVKRRKRLGDSLRRFSPQEWVNYGVQRNARTVDEVTSGP